MFVMDVELFTWSIVWLRNNVQCSRKKMVSNVGHVASAKPVLVAFSMN